MMNKDDIKKILRRRDSIRIRIRELKDRPEYRNIIIGKVIEFNELTQLLVDEGRPVSIKTDHLTYEYWGITDKLIKDYKENPAKYSEKSLQHQSVKKLIKNVKHSQSVTDSKSITSKSKKVDTPDKKIINKYIISFAWSGIDVDIVINKVKEYFSDMDLKEIGSDKYEVNGEIENIIKYEFEGSDGEFKMLKYSAQFILDTLTENSHMNFKTAIYGKKK